MWACLHEHDILFSPISVWIQSKSNYYFLGKRPPVENLFGRAASFITVGDIFLLSHHFAAEDRYLKFWRWGGSACVPSRSALSLPWQLPRARGTREGAWGSPFCYQAQAMYSSLSKYWVRMRLLNVTDKWEGWLTMRQLLPDSNFPKLWLCFLPALQKTRHNYKLNIKTLKIKHPFHLFLHAFCSYKPLSRWTVKVTFSYFLPPDREGEVFA